MMPEKVFLDQVHDLFTVLSGLFCSFLFLKLQGWNVKAMEVLILLIKFEPINILNTIES